MITINYQNHKCEVKVTRYVNNNQPAILLIGAPGTPVAGQSIAMATACFEQFTDGVTTAIKDYSENFGMLNVLKANGLVETTGETIKSGFVELAVVRLSDNLLRELPDLEQESGAA